MSQTYRDKVEELFHGVEERLVRRTADLQREGGLYMSRNLFIPAENVFWQILMHNPGNIPALVNMGHLSAMKGDFVNAAHYLNRAVTIEPLNAPAHYNLSMVYQKQGRLAEAQAEMIKFREAEAVAKQRGGPPVP